MRLIFSTFVVVSCALSCCVALAEEKPTVVATWEHQVIGRDTKPSTIKLYSNHKINDPDSKNTWSRSGNTLILRWPNPKAPGGEWVDQCTVSTDGGTFSGRNQIGVKISGKLVSDASRVKPKDPPGNPAPVSERAAPVEPNPKSTEVAPPTNSEQIRRLEQNASKGDPSAICQLAVCYANGNGVPKNETKAYELMTQAAKAGDGEAMYRLSLIFRRGQGVARDVAKADEWLKKSTQTRFDPRSLGTPGQTVSANTGPVGKSPVNIEAVERRAKAGNVQSMYEMGVYYCTGNGVPKDEKTGFSWLERAAKAGHVDSMNDVGCCYYYGVGVKKDLNLAKEWLTKSAQAGSPLAQRAFAKASGNSSWKDLSEDQKKKLTIGLLMLAWAATPGPSDEAVKQEQENAAALRQYFRDRENQERYQQGLPPK